MARRYKGVSGKPYHPTLPNITYNPKVLAPIPLQRLPPPQPKPETRNYPYTFNQSRKTLFPIKRLIPAQMQERMEKRLCFNYDEKFHLGHKCSKPIIFLLEGLEDPEEEEAESSEAKLALIQPKEPTTKEEELGELLGISLNPMTGSLSPKTMRVKGFINDKKVLVLVDTGSTHSFVDPNVARMAKLAVGESHLIVKVANGDIIPCMG